MGLRQLRNSCPPISESFPCWYLKCRPRSCHCGGSGDDRSHLGLFSSKICDNQEQEDPETSPVMTRGRVRRVTGRGSSGRGRVGGRKFITGIKSQRVAFLIWLIRNRLLTNAPLVFPLLFDHILTLVYE